MIFMERPTLQQLRKLVGVGNYQFGKGVGESLFKRGIEVTCSKRTGRIRHIFSEGKLIATLRPKDGYLALTPHGALMLLRKVKDPPNLVLVRNEVADFIKAGGDVFAKHVVRSDENLRPAEEVIVVDENQQLLAVGRAILSGVDMKHFKRGIAVRTRRGVAEMSQHDVDESES